MVGVVEEKLGLKKGYVLGGFRSILKQIKPTSPGRRQRRVLKDPLVSSESPVKWLVSGGSKASGRNKAGRITVRRRGGGYKRVRRDVSSMNLDMGSLLGSGDGNGVSAQVLRVEYDPNRSSYLALVKFKRSNLLSYIPAEESIRPGKEIHIIDSTAGYEPGNRFLIGELPLKTRVCLVETQPGSGPKLIRAAGVSGDILRQDGDGVVIRLPSKQEYRVHKDCAATIGSLSKSLHREVNRGKAGVSRWQGRRPKVRGVAINPVDHPMGGGEGRSSGGGTSVSPWGWLTKGGRRRIKHKKLLKEGKARRYGGLDHYHSHGKK